MAVLLTLNGAQHLRFFMGQAVYTGLISSRPCLSLYYKGSHDVQHVEELVHVGPDGAVP